MDAFSVFLDIFNIHEPRMKFKSSVSISSIDYIDTSVFKDPDNIKIWVTKAFLNQWTHTPVVTQTFVLSKTHIQGFSKVISNGLFQNMFQE